MAKEDLCTRCGEPIERYLEFTCTSCKSLFCRCIRHEKLHRSSCEDCGMEYISFEEREGSSLKKNELNWLGEMHCQGIPCPKCKTPITQKEAKDVKK